MAKSKNGGTRSYLRGRIASDVYSIGKDSKGNKQQVVRSLAETVANPQTTAQMRGRMIMSTVMQAVSGLSQLIDHSFDNVAAGQPNISEFIRRNYALIKSDVANHPTEGNSFGLVQYGEKGAKGGAYVIAAGSAIMPSVVIAEETASSSIRFTITPGSTTAAQFRDSLGLGEDEYLTVVIIRKDGQTVFYRLRPSSTLSDDAVITADNAISLFEVENPFGLNLTSLLGANSFSISIDDEYVAASGVVVTRKLAGKFIHNDCVMVPDIELDYTADVALSTYPVGTNKFLNGGDLAGASSSSVSTSGSVDSDSSDNDDDGPSGGGAGEVLSD